MNEAINRALLEVRKATRSVSIDEFSVLKDCFKVLKCFEEGTKEIPGTFFIYLFFVNCKFIIENYFQLR